MAYSLRDNESEGDGVVDQGNEDRERKGRDRMKRAEATRCSIYLQTNFLYLRRTTSMQHTRARARVEYFPSITFNIERSPMNQRNQSNFRKYFANINNAFTLPVNFAIALQNKQITLEFDLEKIKFKE